MDIDLDQLRELMQALRDFELDELEIEHGEERVVLRRSTSPGFVSAAVPASIAPPPLAPVVAPAVEPVIEGDFITSPFVGTFYRAPSPGADAFIKKGASFETGQTLCIVEAMKLMNEIEAEFDGVIEEILVENGKPVEYGDPLFRVAKD